jgi:soluble lytic murein transglycosylase-like protein
VRGKFVLSILLAAMLTELPFVLAFPEVEMDLDPIWRWENLCRQVGQEEEVDWRLLLTIVALESRGNPQAQGEAGEVGLAQIMPLSGRPSAQELLDPETNLRTAARLLKSYYRQTGSWRRALLAYNWGIGMVLRFPDWKDSPTGYLARMKGTWLKLFGAEERPIWEGKQEN